MSSRTFQLYDLRVEVQSPKDSRPMLCSSQPGDYFELKGEVLTLPPGQGFSVYSLGSVLPLLPAKQRSTSQADWMSREDVLACPDPACGSTMKVIRTAVSTWEQKETGEVVLLEKKAL
ncbi:hypothetical protein BD324DRAFT_649089 [Kockovaella imperatae]|uniref:TIGR04076 family protein n=1 Tax=Kockovaella imperatae TaxID=4999 RepID=A0A1Y1ULX3_9TREE|nr:hypothetical protein BD324DRAFT_649089 [Kockovaella imperatae]ORX38992.1 hypothetical protein BD324DRAFT_649089 [Kockovaella imperatae]